MRHPLFLVAATLMLFGCDAPPPDDLGPVDGSLAPCPSTPNCVHTGMRHPDGTQGMYLAGGIVEADVMAGIREVVESMPRTTVITQEGAYLHAEVRSRVFRFVDDLELVAGPDGELVVRSASRVGRSDMGVNERRVERLRERLQEAGLIR